MHLLFSYGTLRDPGVQAAVFGRAVACTDDALPGFRVDQVAITDPDGTEHVDMFVVPPADCEISHEHCYVKFGPHSAQGDLKTYKVKVEPVNGTGLDLTFEALVERGGETLRLRAGETLTVPRGTEHRLSNPSPSRLRLIEIGCGEALGDEDTVRLDG